MAHQQNSNDSVLAAYRGTIAFRKASDALRFGKTAFLDMPEPILAFRRDHDGQALTAVFNLSRTPLSVAVAGDTTSAARSTPRWRAARCTCRRTASPG